MEQNEVLEIDLIKLVKVLLKKAWIIILVAVIAAGAVFAVDTVSHETSYRAETTVFIVPFADRDLNLSSDTGVRSATYRELLKSDSVLSKAIEAAGLDLTARQAAGMIAAERLENTELLSITVTAGDAGMAMALANALPGALAETVVPLHGENAVGVVDRAEAAASAGAASGLKDALVAAVLAGVLACAAVVFVQILSDRKTAAKKA